MFTVVLPSCFSVSLCAGCNTVCTESPDCTAPTPHRHTTRRGTGHRCASTASEALLGTRNHTGCAVNNTVLSESQVSHEPTCTDAAHGIVAAHSSLFNQLDRETGKPVTSDSFNDVPCNEVVDECKHFSQDKDKNLPAGAGIKIDCL